MTSEADYARLRKQMWTHDTPAKPRWRLVAIYNYSDRSDHPNNLHNHWQQRLKCLTAKLRIIRGARHIAVYHRIA